MTDQNVVRLGQVNSSGATDALFKHVFPGEVLAAFNAKCVMKQLVSTRNITGGDHAVFPATGKSEASYHTPGNVIIGNNFNQNERKIYCDQLLIADHFVADIDAAMAYFESRAEIAKQMGEALAVKTDKQLLQVAVLAARASAVVTGLSGGSALTHASAKTDSDVLISMLFDAAKALDEKDAPEEGRVVVLKPAQYYLLTQNTKVLNRDWGGDGSFSMAKLPYVAGFRVVRSNHLPTTNISSAETGVNANNTYHGDFSKTAAICFVPGAVGSVSLIGLQMQKDYQIERQGTLMVARMACGHGILRPEQAVELAVT